MSTIAAVTEAGLDQTHGVELTPKNTRTLRSHEKGLREAATTSSSPATAAEPDHQQYDTGPPPDGGLTAWSQVLAVHLGGAITWGYGVGFSVFQLYYRETALPMLSASQISWIGSIQIFLAWTISMAAGRLGDMGYVRVCYGVGGILTVTGMMLTSICTEYWHFLLCQGVLNGIGSGILFLPAAANVGTYFQRNRNIAMALGSVGTSLGGVLFPAIVQYLTPRVGFGWSVRVCGFVSLAMNLCGLAVLRQRNLFKTPRPMVDWTAFKNQRFSAYCAAVFLMHFSLIPVMFYINSFARETIGIASLEAINFVLIANGAAAFARPVVGIVADRVLGAPNTYVCCALGFSALAYGWIGVQTRADMYGFAVVLGVVNGGCQGIFPGATSTLISEESGDLSKMGTWMGMVFAVCGVASLAGPPIIGAIIGSSGGRYIWAQVVLGSLLFASAGMLFLAPRVKGRAEKEDAIETSS
ncbi:major facilitator superfamily domain-containing protein [Microdochium trichocladiopsis]|uniref:Major facilitator superfamily domain-containing protein n=1 Tax=Microdochium trichocladiopsis TaxID=1682393 RepID=A0A9P8Y0A7_9PEZI|nr:major facilitator superfamily domain-containing protein [Microdochium trichocladiopsis]KAH7024898.1 major facilitator superfamily domain-containing protein [Microdochium trichocladiopsis]